ncbi:MAG: hypothetical protein AB2693_29495 [Candidatus Thiodiazotropha sp.]
MQWKSRLLSERFPPPAGIVPGTAKSVGQRLTHLATGALDTLGVVQNLVFADS